MTLFDEIKTLDPALVASRDYAAIAAEATGAGVLTLTGFPRSDTSADATGTAAAARIRTSAGGTDIITGLTVGLSGTDVILDSLSVTAGQTLTVNTGTFTHAA